MGACLFCLVIDGEPSAEHVVPLGLGPHADLILPADAVCRECNSWLGRQVDEPFMQLFEIQLIRGMFRVPDRKGRTVDSIELADGIGTLTFGSDGHVHLTQYVPHGERMPPAPAAGENADGARPTTPDEAHGSATTHSACAAEDGAGHHLP